MTKIEKVMTTSSKSSSDSFDLKYLNLFIVTVFVCIRVYMIGVPLRHSVPVGVRRQHCRTSSLGLGDQSQVAMLVW